MPYTILKNAQVKHACMYVSIYIVEAYLCVGEWVCGWTPPPPPPHTHTQTHVRDSHASNADEKVLRVFVFPVFFMKVVLTSMTGGISRVCVCVCVLVCVCVCVCVCVLCVCVCVFVFVFVVCVYV